MLLVSRRAVDFVRWHHIVNAAELISSGSFSWVLQDCLPHGQSRRLLIIMTLLLLFPTWCL